MAFTYANGRYPLSTFIHRGDNIYLTPSLNARWNEAVRLAQAKYGVRLYITGDVDGLGGWNGYRPYPAQVRYKNHYGRFAAAPGWSSHGGRYGGREVFAIDVANWQQLGRDDAQAWGRFVAIMRLVGLTADFVSPRELWHVGDFNSPWVVPTFAAPAGVIKPIPVVREEDEDDMSTIRYVHRAEPGYATEWMIVGMELPGGFETTTDETTAVGWGAIYGTDKGDSWKALNRKQYIALQQSAAKLHKRWVEMQKAIRS